MALCLICKPVFYKFFAIKKKVGVLENVDSGLMKKDVELKFGIPANSSTINIKSREAILKQREIIFDCHYITVKHHGMKENVIFRECADVNNKDCN